MSIEITDNTEKFLEAFDRQLAAALEAIGQQAVSHAKNNIKEAGRKDTGALQNSVTHITRIAEKAAYVGTNMEYAVYHELGTGRFAEGKGRSGWWVYVPGSTKRGTNTGKVYTREEAARIVAILQSQGIDAHMTEGIKPIHFLQKAASEHGDEYKGIVEQYLKD